MAKITVQDIAERKRKRQEEENKASSSTETYSSRADRINKRIMQNKIGFDTLESDLNSLGTTVNNIYDNWHDANIMTTTKSQVQSMYDRLNQFQEYNKIYGDGSVDVTETINSYKKTLDEWDDLSSFYGQYKTIDDYKGALQKEEDEKKRKEEMGVADLNALQTEIGDLDAILQKAEGINSNIHYGATTRANAVEIANKNNQYTKELQDYLSQNGYKNIDELRNAVSDKKFYKDEAQKIQDENALNKKHSEMATSEEGKLGWEKWLKIQEDRAKKASETSAFEEGIIRGFTTSSDSPFGTTINNIIYDKRKDTSYQEPQDDWTEEEKNIFGAYLYANDPYAWEYASKLNNAKAIEKENNTKAKIEKSSTESAGGAVLNWAGARVGNVFGLADYLDDLTDVAAGRNTIVEEGVVTPFEYSQTVTSSQSSALNKWSGTLPEDIPVIGGKGAGDVYGLITSVVDSTASRTLGPVGTAINYFGQGAASAVDDAVARGANAKEATLYGAFVGAGEAVSEYIGADKLMKLGSSKNLKGFFAKAFKNAGAEGLEGGFSSVIDKVADAWVLGDKSAYAEKIRQYRLNGMSESEAITKAFMDTVEEVAFDSLNEALAGFAQSAPKIARANVRERKIGQTIKSNNSTKGMLETLSMTPQESEVYQIYTNLVNSGVTAENITDKQLGGLYSEAYTAAREILESPNSTAEQKENAKKIIRDLASYSQNKSISRMGKKNIKQVYGQDNGEALIAEALENDENSESHKLAVELQKKIDEGKKLTTDDITKLVDANQSAYKGDVTTEAKTKLSEYGEKTAVDNIAEIIAKKSTGEMLSSTETDILESSEYGNLVYNEINHEDLVESTNGMDKAERNLFISLYDGKTSVDRYAAQYNLVKGYAKNRFSINHMLDNRGVLSPKAVKAINKMFATDKDSAHQNVIDEFKAKHKESPFIYGTFDDSVIDYENKGTKGKVNVDSLTSSQRNAITIVGGMAQQAGLDVELVLDGEERGFNGAFSISGNKILIDVYAGMEKVDLTNLSHLIFPTVAHEMTHWMKAKSPVMYQKYGDYVIESIKQATGLTESEILQRRRLRLEANHPGQTFTDEYVRDEVIARASEDMFGQSKVIREFLESDTLTESEKKTFVEKVKEFFKQIKEWFENYIKKNVSNAPEVQDIRKVPDRIQKQIEMWDKMLVDAIATNQAMKHEGITAESLAESNIAGPDMQLSEIENPNIDKYGFRQDNVSRANKQGELINDYYYALNKKEWKIFYDKITKSGYLATANVGVVAPIVVNNKLIIAERLYTGKDAHDYVVTDAYKLFAEDGDTYTLSLIQDALNKGDIEYDTQRIFSFVNRLNRLDGRNELLARYNRDNSRFDVTIDNGEQKKSISGIHGDSQKGIAGERVSFRDKSNIQKDDELLKKSDRDNIGRELSKGQANYFKDSKVRDENGNKAYMSTKEYVKKELGKELAVRDDISAKLADTSEDGIIPTFIREANALYEKQNDMQLAEIDYPIDATIEKIVNDAFNNTKSVMRELSVISSAQSKAINRLGNITHNDFYKGNYEGGKHLVSDDAIKHIIAEHGDFLREGLRAQLPMTKADIARHLSAVKDDKKPSKIEPSSTKRGTPSIVSSYEVNGYTLYAEEITKPLGQNNPSSLIGHTMYKAPTLATAAFYTTSVQTQPKRQSMVLCNYNTPNNANLSRGNFVADANGEPALLNFIAQNGVANQDASAAGLIALSSDSKNFTDKSGSVEQGYVICKKPFYITQDNRVFSNSDSNVAELINEKKKQGYDCFIFDKVNGDNYMVAVVNKAQIIKNKPTIVNQQQNADRDKAYMDAVNRGDMETVQRMVEEAARESGYNSPMLFHGTDHFGFTSIDTSVNHGDGISFWASNKKETSGTYTTVPRVREITEQYDNSIAEDVVDGVDADIDDAIAEFCRKISYYFSEWVFGYGGGNSYVREIVEKYYDKDDSTVVDGGLYEELIDIVINSYNDYGEEYQDSYEDFADWQEDSKEWEDIEEKIIALESLVIKRNNIYDSYETSGIYSLYGNTDNFFEVDGNGTNWNNIRSTKLPTLNRYGINDVAYNTRDVVKWASENGYDGVVFRSIKDNGGKGYAGLNDVYAFFKPKSQVKSADPVTYDDEGNVIPLSQRFNKANDDIRYSDRDYVAYDMTAILKESTIDKYLRNYAAPSTPNYAQAYITYMRPNDFLSLTTSGVGSQMAIENETKEFNREEFEDYTRNQVPIFLRIDHESGEVTSHEGRHRMVALSREGIHDVPVLLFDSSNKYDKTNIDELKLIGQFSEWHTAIIRDAIPLSYANRDAVIEKFGTMSKRQQQNAKYGIRETLQYSDRDKVSVYETIGDTERIIKENAKLKEDVERLKERLKLERQVTHGNYFNQNQLDAVAGHIRNIANSNYAKKDLVTLLNGVYSYIAHSEDLNWQDLFAQCYDIASMVLDESKPATVTNDYFKLIMNDIRGTTISLNQAQMQEAKNRFGNKWRNNFFGKIKIADGATSLDRQWQSWASTYPNLFDAKISDADMLVELYDIYDSVKESSETYVEYDVEEQTRWLAREIYNQYWNVSPIRTTADRYNKEIKLLNFEHKRTMKELRDSYEERLSNQKKIDKARYKEIIRDIRERKDKEIANIKQRSKERMDAYKENAERKAKIQTITANALTLNKWLTKNSKDEHIHESLKGPVVNLLQAIDFSSKRLLDKNLPTQKDVSFTKALSQVKDMLMDASVGKEELVALYGADLNDDIKSLVDSVDNIMRTVGDNEFVLNKMSLDELQVLDNIVKTIKHAVTKMNKFHSVNHAQGIANLSQEEIIYADKLGKAKVYDPSTLKGRAKKLISWGNALPIHAFRRFGNAGKKIFEAFQNGWDKFAFNVKEIIDYTRNTYTSKEVKEWEKDIKTFEIKMVGTGEKQTIQMSVPQIMSLYCLQKREQARNHMLGGGIRVADIKVKKGEIISQTEGAVLTLKDIDAIVDSLTDRQIEVANELQKFMNTVCSNWGNEISMSRFGYKAFGEENYFPIQSDKNNLAVDDETEQNNSLFKLLNMSFTKSVNINANNRIVISNIFDVFAQHTSDMAKYNALALPVLDAFRWYNYTEKGKVGGETQFITKSVKQSIENAFGKDGKEYITTFLKDINGEREVSRDTLGKHFFTNAKIAAVGANLRVMLLQPTSYVRASAVIGNKYLTKALLHKPKIKQAEKYCGMALWKSMGYYDTNIQRGVEDQIKHNETFKDKAVEWSMKGAEMADKYTWGYLWNACELEIREKRKDLKVGSEEFYTEIGKRLREVIYETQVVDSTMTRSQMMRSSNFYDKMLTAFASEPTLAYSMLQDAVMTARLEKRANGAVGNESRKKIAKVMVAYTLTNAVAALVESGFDAFRDEDDEEMELEDFMLAYLQNFAIDMSITNKIPYIKEITSMLQGFSSSRSDTQWMESIVNAFKGAFKLANGEGNPTTVLKHWWKALSYLSGLPLYNGYRDFMATLNKLDILTAEELEEWLDDLFN